MRLSEFTHKSTETTIFATHAGQSKDIPENSHTDSSHSHSIECTAKRTENRGLHLKMFTFLEPIPSQVLSQFYKKSVSYFPKNPVRLYDTGILSFASIFNSSSAARSFSSNLSMFATCILYISASLCKAGYVVWNVFFCQTCTSFTLNLQWFTINLQAFQRWQHQDEGRFQQCHFLEQLVHVTPLLWPTSH